MQLIHPKVRRCHQCQAPQDWRRHLSLSNASLSIVVAAVSVTTVLFSQIGQLNDLGSHLPHVAEAGEGLLLSVFTVYHAYFHRMHSQVQRIGAALLKTGGRANGKLH